MGVPDRALAQSNPAIDEARRLAHSTSLASSVGLDVILLSLVGDDAVLGERVDQLIAVAAEQGFFTPIFASYLLVLKREGKSFPWAKVLTWTAVVAAVIGAAAFAKAPQFR